MHGAFGPEHTLAFLGYDPRRGGGDWRTSDAWPTDIAATLNAAPQNYFAWSAGEEGQLAFGTSLRYTQTPPVVPEPSTLLLLGIGVLAGGLRRWRARTPS
jgi:hypothetical protein